MTTINDFIDQSNPFLTVTEKFQVGVCTVTAEVYGTEYEQFPVIHVTSYEPFLVTPDVELTGDIVFTDEGEFVWSSRVQISIHGETPIPFDVARYDFPEISAQVQVYLTNLFSTVWTNEVGYMVTYSLHNKLVRPISVRFSDVSRKLTAANNKIEEVEKLIATLPELIAARDSIEEKVAEVRGEYKAAETTYNEKVGKLPAVNEVKTEIIYPVRVPTENKTVIQENVAKKKKWWK